MWIQIDNAFCVGFYLLLSLIIGFKIMVNGDGEILNESSLMFYLILLLIHAYMLCSFKFLYDDLKSEELRLASIALSQEEYDTLIDEERKKLNGGYECPLSQNMLQELQGRVQEAQSTRGEGIYEALGKPSKIVRASYADIQELKKILTKKPIDSANDYDEIRKTRNAGSVYDRISKF